MAVRRESVRLELEDNFSRKMLAAAAATNALKDSLGDLDGTSVRSSRSINQVSKDTDSLSRSAVQGSAAIDRFSGRMGILLKLAGSLGPALIPIGAIAVPAVTGLANQFGFAAIAAGTAVLAFQGVGDTLKAVNDAALDPSVDNLRAAREALESLSPAGRDLVGQLQAMRPFLTELRDTAAGALFPGLIEGFESLSQLGPQLTPILSAVGDTLGDLFAEGAESLTSGRWSDFFHMLATDARPVLTDMGHALGSVVHGLSEMWEAFMPLNRDFGSWLADSARSFDRWATGLSQTDGFQEFVTYLRENGPRVADAMSSIGDALVQIVEAAAPLGGPILEGIARLADAIAIIADSPLGTPIMAAVTAISALSLASNVASASVARLSTALGGLGATGAASGASAAAGGPVGLILASIAASAANATAQFQKMEDEGQSLGETLARSFVPGIREASAFEEFFGGAEEPFLKASIAAMDFSGAVRQAGGSARRSREPIDLLSVSLARQREAAREGAQGFRDLTSSMKPKNFDLGKWLNQLEQQARALRNFRINAQQAAEKGLRRGLIRELQRLGPEGAVQLEHLANASRTNINRANEAWRSLQTETRKARTDIKATGDELETVGRKHVKPRVDVQSNAEGIIARVNNALSGIDGRTANTYIVTHLRTVREGNDTAGGPPAPNGTFSSGGYTGDIDPRAVAGRVHGREVVLPAGIVQRDRAMLLARYGHLPGMGMLASRGSERPAGSGQRLNINVTADNLRGSFKTSQGVFDLEGEIRAIARDEIDQSRNFEQSQR